MWYSSRMRLALSHYSNVIMNPVWWYFAHLKHVFKRWCTLLSLIPSTANWDEIQYLFNSNNDLKSKILLVQDGGLSYMLITPAASWPSWKASTNCETALYKALLPCTSHRPSLWPCATFLPGRNVQLLKSTRVIMLLDVNVCGLLTCSPTTLQEWHW